jgi:hypothetical protein
MPLPGSHDHLGFARLAQLAAARPPRPQLLLPLGAADVGEPEAGGVLRAGGVPVPRLLLSLHSHGAHAVDRLSRAPRRSDRFMHTYMAPLRIDYQRADSQSCRTSISARAAAVSGGRSAARTDAPSSGHTKCK